jgi:regulatory protein
MKSAPLSVELLGTRRQPLAPAIFCSFYDHQVKRGPGMSAKDDRSAAHGPRVGGRVAVTEQGLEQAALRYLERFASSGANLRRVLLRRVRRLDPEGAEGGAKLVDTVIARLEGSGLLDDRRYAEAKTASLHRRGASSRLIDAALKSRGVDPSLIRATLADQATARPGGDLAAAAALLRRRRLGPFRVAATREAHQTKDLATLARAGFSRAVAERVLGAADVEELERLILD